MITANKTISSGTRTARIERSLPRVLAVVVFAALTAIGAKLAVPLLLSGIALGPRLGATSQLLYLGAGIAGLPVFMAGGGLAYLLGPTGGYLLAFPIAAAIVGWSAGRSRGVLPMIAGAVLGVAFIHLSGMSWLATLGGGSAVFRVGVLPFLPGDVLKIALAVLIGGRLRARLRGALG
jgi:biotin transport system substrate-specific component